MSSTDAAAREIERLEQVRCQALVASDIATLAELMADDLVHIHGDGRADDKAGYLFGVEHRYRFHAVERGDLMVRIYGDVAVVNGPLQQVLSIDGAARRTITAMVTQVWVRKADGWKHSTCHTAVLTVS